MTNLSLKSLFGGSSKNGTRRRSLSDIVFDARNRLFQDPSFQKWAAAFPLTAPITRRRAGRLFDICAGFTYTQILCACVELELFDLLADGAVPEAKIASSIDLSTEATERLIAGAIALDLVQRRPNKHIGLGAQGAALLGNRSVFEMIKHHKILYKDLIDPVALLKGGRAETGLSQYWGYARRASSADLSKDEAAPYTNLMAATQEFIADDVIAAFSFSRQRHLLDIGGGGGAFVRAVAENHPSLRATVFDLPVVAEQANSNFAKAGLEERVQAVGGDFFSDPFPQGADIISFVRVLHDHDDDAALQLLRSARSALSEGGTLLIAEPMSETPGAAAMGDAYFGFYLWAMGSGRPRSAKILTEFLRVSGFPKARLLRARQPLLTSVLVAST
ncbi:MAG: methyltransferase [Pseudomonadota bacterium]